VLGKTSRKHVVAPERWGELQGALDAAPARINDDGKAELVVWRDDGSADVVAVGRREDGSAYVASWSWLKGSNQLHNRIEAGGWLRGLEELRRWSEGTPRGVRWRR